MAIGSETFTIVIPVVALLSFTRAFARPTATTATVAIASSIMIVIIVTSIGRFAVYREFVNIENSPHDCAQDRQEDPQDGAQDRQEELQGDHFWPRWCPRSPRGAPRGSFWGQDDAQDRPEERQGDDFMVKMVPKVAKRSPKGDILGPRWCSRSSAKFFKAKVTKSVRVLLKTRI